jgi:hypothetical protein
MEIVVEIPLEQIELSEIEPGLGSGNRHQQNTVRRRSYLLLVARIT